MIRYGILSTARIVPRFVAGLNESENACAFALASREANRAKELSEKLGIDRCYGNYQELYEDPEVDIIYIPTTNDTHYRYAREALLHHKNVLLEKPFTLDYRESCELFEIAEKNGCFLMEDQKVLLLPVTRKVKEIVDNGEIGEIKRVSLNISHPGRHEEGNWMYDIERGGGALNGSGSYPLEFMLYFLGLNDYEFEAEFTQSEETADNLALVKARHDDIIIDIGISMNVPLDNKAVITGTKGLIEIDEFWKSSHFTLIENGRKKEFDYPYSSEFVYTIDHVNECLEKKKLTSDIVTKEITLESTRIIQELYRNYEYKKSSD